MDHLPLPAGCDGHPSVPYFDFPGKRCRYGINSFTEFPTLNGYNKSLLLHEHDITDGGRLSKSHAIAFVQKWLWFGLLSEFLKSDFNSEHFVCCDAPNGPVINTKWLPYILTEWSRKTDGMSPEDRRERFARNTVLLSEANEYVREMISYNRFDDARNQSIIPDEVSLSIQILGWTLGKIFFILRRWHGHPTDPLFAWGGSRWAIRRMLEHGWCRSSIPPIL